MSRRGRLLSDPRRRVRGFSVLEVVITISLSLVIVAAAAKVYSAFKQSYRVQQALSQIQDSGRHAIYMLVSDTRNARYLGQIHEYWNTQEAPSPNALPVISGECFTRATMPYRWVDPFVAQDSGAAPGTLAAFAPNLAGANESIGPFAGCIPAASWQPDTDVVSVHSVAVKPIPATALHAGVMYVRSDLNHAVVFYCGTSGAICLPAGTWDKETEAIYPLYAAVFWVRKCTKPGRDDVCGTVDDLDQPNLPALMRTSIGDSGSIESDVVAPGVSNLQVEYGIDYDDVGYPQQYVGANAIGDLNNMASWDAWQRVRTVRFSLLVRSGVTEPTYQGPTTFEIGDHTGQNAIVGPANYRQLLFTDTVSLRNYKD